MEEQSFGKRLQNARKKAGITQAELAQRIGVAAITIRQYEAGKREPSLEQIENLAQALGVYPHELMGWGEAEKVTIERTVRGEEQTRLLPKISVTLGEPDLEPDEFNPFSMFIQSLGYCLHLAGDHYNLEKDGVAIPLSPDELKALVRHSGAALEPILQLVMESHSEGK